MSQELLLAVQQGQLAEVEALFEEGADVNYQNVEGLSALHVAANNLNIPMIAYLLARPGVLVNLADRDDHTPLNHLYYECEDIVEDIDLLLTALELLSTHHADLNHPDRTGETFMMWAAFNGYCAIVERLLDKGADATGAVDAAMEAAETVADVNMDMINLLTRRLNLEGDSVPTEYDDERDDSLYSPCQPN